VGLGERRLAVKDERRISASASRTVTFLRGKDTEDPTSLFEFPSGVVLRMQLPVDTSLMHRNHST
jgi:hypothetical protein